MAMAEPPPAAMAEPHTLVPKSMPQLIPTMLSLLKAIEPETIYAGYDSTIPDTSTRLMTTLNRLGGRQVISAVKWAKALPGEEGTPRPGPRWALSVSPSIAGTQGLHLWSWQDKSCQLDFQE